MSTLGTDKMGLTSSKTCQIFFINSLYIGIFILCIVTHRVPYLDNKRLIKREKRSENTKKSLFLHFSTFNNFLIIHDRYLKLCRIKLCIIYFTNQLKYNSVVTPK